MWIPYILLSLFIYNDLVASDRESEPEPLKSRTYIDLSRVESFSPRSYSFSSELSGENRGRGRALSYDNIGSPKKSNITPRNLTKRLPSSPLAKIIGEEKKEREKKKKEDAVKEEKKRGLAALNLFIKTGPYAGPNLKNFCTEQARDTYLRLKKEEAQKRDLFKESFHSPEEYVITYEEAEAYSTPVENSSRHTPRSPELECYRIMLEKQKILPALDGAQKDSPIGSLGSSGSTDKAFDLLKHYKDTISAITRFDETSWQVDRPQEEIRKLFNLIESVLGTITEILIEYIKTQESSLDGYRGVLFGSISHELDEAIGEQQQAPTYYKKLYLQAITSVFSGDMGKLEECLRKLNELIVDRADCILSESSKAPKERVVYYKNLIIAAGKQEVDKYRKLLDALQLGLNGSSNLLSGEDAVLKSTHNLLKLAEEWNKLLLDGESDVCIAEKPEGVLLLEHYNESIFALAIQRLSESEIAREQEGREYYNRLKLDACKQILYEDMKKYQTQYIVDLGSLKRTLMNIKRFRESRKKFEKGRSQLPSTSVLMGLPSVEVNEIGAHISYFEQLEVACNRLLNLFNKFAEKKEYERLEEALKAFVKIEAIKRTQKGRKQENVLDAIAIERFLQGIPEKTKKEEKKEKR